MDLINLVFSQLLTFVAVLNYLIKLLYLSSHLLLIFSILFEIFQIVGKGLTL